SETRRSISCVPFRSSRRSPSWRPCARRRFLSFRSTPLGASGAPIRRCPRASAAPFSATRRAFFTAFSRSLRRLRSSDDTEFSSAHEDRAILDGVKEHLLLPIDPPLHVARRRQGRALDRDRADLRLEQACRLLKGPLDTPWDR